MSPFWFSVLVTIAYFGLCALTIYVFWAATKRRK